MKHRKKLLSSAVIASFAAAPLVIASPALAHGYVNGPESRAYLCKTGANVNCGGVQYEPQSLEGPKGFPAGGPADGQIASAGGLFGGTLDEQSSTRWSKTDIPSGPLLIDWTYTAPHSTDKWHYYMTKPGWNPNDQLDRSDLELLTTVQHDGSKANTNPDHVIDVPADRTGYHIILAVWDIADTVNAFYDVIDVNVTGEGGAVVPPLPQPPIEQPEPLEESVDAPAVPTNVHTMGTTSTSVDLMWAPINADGAVTYKVYRNGQVVQTTTAGRVMDAGLLPNTSYTYVVTATPTTGSAAGVESRPSDAYTVVTRSAPPADTGTWNAKARYIKGDQVIFNSVTYVAVQTHTGVGDPSWITARSLWEPVVATAPMPMPMPMPMPTPTPTPAPAPTPAPTPAPSASAWQLKGSYIKGDRVTFNGTEYRAVQSHTGNGDPNWIYALSLWQPIS